MSSTDDPDDFKIPIFQHSARRPAREVDAHLLEALMYVLIEKGVLTKNDALSVVETAAHVKRGEREEAGDASHAEADLELLQRLYASFEALDDQPGVVNFDGENVYRLRRPIHGDRPTFPGDD